MYSLTKNSQKNVRDIIHFEILLGVITIFGALFYKYDFNFYYLIPAGVFALFYIPFAFNSKSKFNQGFGNRLSNITRKLEIWSIGNEWWIKWVPLIIISGALLTITILIGMVSIFFIFLTVSLLSVMFKKMADKNK